MPFLIHFESKINHALSLRLKINEQIIVFVSTSKKFYLILRNCCFVEAVDCPQVIP